MRPFNITTAALLRNNKTMMSVGHENLKLHKEDIEASIPKCYFCIKWKGTLVVQASKNKRSREAPKKFVEKLVHGISA